MSQIKFICPNRCIDLIPFDEKLYACCKDGIYELKRYDSLDFDDEEDDIFSEAKRPCRLIPVSEDVHGLLKVEPVKE